MHWRYGLKRCTESLEHQHWFLLGSNSTSNTTLIKQFEQRTISNQPISRSRETPFELQTIAAWRVALPAAWQQYGSIHMSCLHIARHQNEHLIFLRFSDTGAVSNCTCFHDQSRNHKTVPAGRQRGGKYRPFVYCSEVSRSRRRSGCWAANFQNFLKLCQIRLKFVSIFSGKIYQCTIVLFYPQPRLWWSPRWTGRSRLRRTILVRAEYFPISAPAVLGLRAPGGTGGSATLGWKEPLWRFLVPPLRF